MSNQNEPRIQNSQLGLYNSLPTAVAGADPNAGATALQAVPRTTPPQLRSLFGRRNLSNLSFVIDSADNFVVNFSLFGYYRVANAHGITAGVCGFNGHRLGVGTATAGQLAPASVELPAAAVQWRYADTITFTPDAYLSTNMVARYAAATDIFNEANAIADMAVTELGDFEGFGLFVWGTAPTNQRWNALYGLGY